MSALTSAVQQQVFAPQRMPQRTLSDIDIDYVRADEQLRIASDTQAVNYWRARREQLAVESQRAVAAATVAEHAEIESSSAHGDSTNNA